MLASACATPVGVTRGDTQALYRTLTRSALSAGKPSAPTEQMLQRLGLVERFKDDPAATLEELRAAGDLTDDRLFALAELTFLHAERRRQPAHYLAAAVYAYAFLFASQRVIDDALDPRARLAADFYNLGLSLGLSRPGSDEVVLADQSVPLPFGQVELFGNPAHFVWGGYQMTRFISVGEYQIRGLRNHYRQPGIGAPLAAEVTAVGTGPEAEAARKRIPPRIKVPVTVFVRFEKVLQGIADGRLRGRLELYPADQATTVELDGRRLPLELEFTSALAYGLEGAPVWDTEFGSFLSAKSEHSRLFTLHPYRPGRVPVVLIHGTASSPARWAEMMNELTNDPRLRNRVQFWFFTYSTSNPILLSASELRQSLQDIVNELDPGGGDPALRRMVLVGHSQGGLLARLMVTESSTRFWNNVTDVPFAEVRGTPEERELFRKAFFFHPLPFVSRVVFIATPHRGSFRVSSMVRIFVRRLVTLPVTLVQDFQDVLRANPDALALEADDVPTAVDNMRPGHRFIRGLAESPIAPGVTAHSIIAVLGTGPVTGKTDGVVAYESAHLDGVASEKVVRSGHSTLAHPETILEVRRILLEHLGQR
ncbi:MAG TPA: alpha/beta fold hydrolase [Methylomirabilota bacterium]|nr:alpha/beta fold hydrolase [Methylomirabilota bacterium]